jgi:acetolactate synthase-1/2/3 large subunit
LLRELVGATNFDHLDLMGCYPASGDRLGMLGMHGLYEANMAMHDCDLMINIGARFDDRITGVLDKFSPNSIQGAHRHRPGFDQGHSDRYRHRRRRRPCA